ncbi:endonuclease/exonuclease/phosphatase family protein [Sphingomonas sp. PB4P5]|uniref:endonuclease/exonuclease/phosphatase family protein n=1 Tax=Parasphingomonas puruogangriensis TaxID=3096155 RepID=UPI002FC8B194
MTKAVRAIIAAGSMLLATGGSTSTIAPVPSDPPSSAGAPSSTALSLMTYNVAGLPWPIASDRPQALTRIAARLAALRRAGRQPHIVVLQEAFTPEAAAIADRAGYANTAFGPDAAARAVTPASPDDRRYLQQARWDRGERWGKQLGSGLIILSDYPIVWVDRMAFPDFACAGFDCLANKGAVIAHLRVPGHLASVAVVDTHLNARKAAGVPLARSQEAYARQVGLLAQFVAAHVAPDQAVLIGGDMNIGADAARSRSFFAAFGQRRLTFVAPELGGAQRALGQTAVDDPRAHRDLLASTRRRKDWVFARLPGGRTMNVARAQVPFGSERDGTTLSDHVGYVIDYGQDQAAPRPVALALNDRSAPGGLR